MTNCKLGAQGDLSKVDWGKAFQPEALAAAERADLVVLRKAKSFKPRRTQTAHWLRNSALRKLIGDGEPQAPLAPLFSGVLRWSGETDVGPLTLLLSLPSPERARHWERLAASDHRISRDGNPLPLLLDIFNGRKVFSIEWEETGRFSRIINFQRGCWEDAVTLLSLETGIQMAGIYGSVGPDRLDRQPFAPQR